MWKSKADRQLLKEKKEQEAKDAAKAKGLREELERRDRIDKIMAKHRAEMDEAAKEAAVREVVYAKNRRQLYTMPHYDRLDIHDDTCAERVPGGWIFYFTSGKDALASTFVPFTEESVETFYKLKNEKFDE